MSVDVSVSLCVRRTPCSLSSSAGRCRDVPSSWFSSARITSSNNKEPSVKCSFYLCSVCSRPLPSLSHLHSQARLVLGHWIKSWTPFPLLPKTKQNTNFCSFSVHLYINYVHLYSVILIGRNNLLILFQGVYYAEGSRTCQQCWTVHCPAEVEGPLSTNV